MSTPDAAAQVRGAAIEAAARAWFHEMYGDGYDDPENWAARAVARDFVRPLVDAVLAVVGPAYRAEACEEIHDELICCPEDSADRDRHTMCRYAGWAAALVKGRAEAEEGS